MTDRQTDRQRERETEREGGSGRERERGDEPVSKSSGPLTYV